MKYQVGDIVLILHSGEEGRVVDIMNHEMMMVDVKGVIFPVYMDQVDFPYFKRFTEKKIVVPKKEKKYVDDVKREKIADKKVADGVWLTFLPVMDTDSYGDDVVEELKIHLLNRTETAYHFTYRVQYFGKTEFELKNTVHPFEDFYLHDVPFEDLNDSPSFELSFSLVEPDKTKAKSKEASVKLKPKQVFTKIKELQEKNEATFSQLLFATYPDKQEEHTDDYSFSPKGTKPYNGKQARQHLEPARSVVDLHIDKITSDWKGLSNFEILTMQLQTFEKYYHLAIAHHQPSLIVIHGVGEGVLRDEIHDLLRLKKEVKSFVNQHHPLYGFGATEIFFQY
ncbi:MAG: Smr/MutS family protein [Chitinophagales bacterium]|nr:Smr/MutS family protein [Chitinophagales bacterium]